MNNLSKKEKEELEVLIQKADDMQNEVNEIVATVNKKLGFDKL